MRAKGSWCWLAIAMAVGCGDTVQVNDTKQGSAGESCDSVNDCRSGLQCIDNVCSSGGGFTSADGGVPTSRGTAGESCASRSDCASGLACVQFVCTAVSSDTEVPELFGRRGESCTTRGDCEAGLACINRVCIEADFMLTASDRECVLVECEADADCCENFTPIFDAASCASYKADCDDVLNVNRASACTTYRSYCDCNRACRESQCAVRDECTITEECVQRLGAGATCNAGRCVGCTSSADCLQADEACVDGMCVAACQTDEQCPLFARCQGGDCVDVGCQTNRECYFATNDPRATCAADGTCQSPCETDVECGPWHVCQDKLCTYVGCETDAECRTLLDLVNQPVGSKVRARCIEAEN